MELQNLLAFVKKCETQYQKYSHEVFRQWDLNATSFQVLMFLADNPGCNTARDVCRMCGIKTGIASIAVEQLIRVGYLRRQTDPYDRRIQRLFVTDAVSELIAEGRKRRTTFSQDLLGVLTQEEKQEYFRLTEKLMGRIGEIERKG